MTLETIDSRAWASELKFVGISDHIDRSEDNWKPEANRDDLAEGEWRCSFLVGCEATVISPRCVAVSDEVAENLDYTMVSANHYHLSHVENPDPREPEGYADHYLDMLEGVLDWGHADVVAHPFLHSKIGKFMDPMEVLGHYDWDRLEDILAQAGGNDLAFEFKPGYPQAAPEFFSHLVDLGREKGVRFSLGGDSHKPREIAYPEDFPAQLRRVGVTAADLIDPRDFT